MQFSVQYNWPMGLNSASFSLGGPNVEDPQWEYRAGVLPKDMPGHVWWPEEWRVGDRDFSFPTFSATIGDEVVVQRRAAGDEEVQTLLRVNIADEWPADAYGASTVHTSWTF